MLIHPTAIIDPDASVHETASVGAFSFVGPGAVIGERVQVEHHCVIGAARIGAGTRVRSFVELRDGTEIGCDCYVDSGVKCSGQCLIGDRVTLRYDAIIARGCTIGDDTFVAPQVMTINLDHTGREIGGARIGKRVHVGTAAVLHPGIVIGDDAVIGACSLVTKSCEPHRTYVGAPARAR